MTTLLQSVIFGWLSGFYVIGVPNKPELVFGHSKEFVASVLASECWKCAAPNALGPPSRLLQGASSTSRRAQHVRKGVPHCLSQWRVRSHSYTQPGCRRAQKTPDFLRALPPAVWADGPARLCSLDRHSPVDLRRTRCKKCTQNCRCVRLWIRSGDHGRSIHSLDGVAACVGFFQCGSAKT
jgi:hypothetical protein